VLASLPVLFESKHSEQRHDLKLDLSEFPGNGTDGIRRSRAIDRCHSQEIRRDEYCAESLMKIVMTQRGRRSFIFQNNIQSIPPKRHDFPPNFKPQNF